MSTSAPAIPAAIDTDLKSFKTPEFKERLNRLRELDNWRNALWIAVEYLYLTVVIGATLVFYFQRGSWGLGWWWNVPVTFVSIFLVGVGQHRLAMLGHEASHRLLFRNRFLNELASNWLLFFPMWGLTHHYRVQHLAHHQFVNDPERDPLILEMAAAGGKFYYPMPLLRFFWDCVARLYLWVPGLVQYSLVRARYAVVGKCPEPYRLKESRPRLLMPLCNMSYIAVLLISLNAARRADRADLLAWIPVALVGTYLAATFFIPARFYNTSKIKPDIPPRWDNFCRMLYITLLFTVLVGLNYFTGVRWGWFYLLLWALPLFTSFAFLMILREEIQHSNVGDGTLEHTRNFRGNAFVRWAVFPYGMAEHLPHHVYPIVPHRRLRDLEALLRESEEYRAGATVVEGYVRRGLAS